MAPRIPMVQVQALKTFTINTSVGIVHGNPKSRHQKARLPEVPETMVDDLRRKGKVALLASSTLERDAEVQTYLDRRRNRFIDEPEGEDEEREADLGMLGGERRPTVGDANTDDLAAADAAAGQGIGSGLDSRSSTRFATHPDEQAQTADDAPVGAGDAVPGPGAHITPTTEQRDEGGDDQGGDDDGDDADDQGSAGDADATERSGDDAPAEETKAEAKPAGRRRGRG